MSVTSMVTLKRLTAFLLLLPSFAGAYSLTTSDGLRLDIDSQSRVAGLKVGNLPLRLQSPGGFFLGDVQNVPAREPELLGNPGFEKVGGDGPLGWSVGSDWIVDKDVARSGKVSMKVSIPGPQKRNSGSLAVETAVKPNTPYRASMWLRTEGGAPHLYIVQMDAAGAPHADYPQICISHARHQSDWFQLSHSFVTAPFCRKIRVYTNLWEQTGTAWIDDVSVVSLEDDYVSPQRLVAGTVKQTSAGVKQTSDLKRQSLRLSATYQATPDHIVVDGEVEDTSGQDRAIALSFRLPFDATGWTWYDDLHNQQAVEPGFTCGGARIFGDRRRIGLYPFAALGDENSALALAVPMDLPRVFRICYDKKFGYFVNYELGLSRATSKFPGRASFRFLIYRIDPEWGLRSAAKHYYDLFPQFFTKRLDREGGAGFMVDAKTFESDSFRPPAAAIFDYWKRDSLEAHRREKAKLFSYTEFSGWWGWALGVTAEKAKQRPSREDAWDYVERLARGDKPSPVAQCVLNCAPYDRDGKPVLHDDYVPEWGGYNYPCNPDPEIEGVGGKVNRFTLTQEREVSQVQDFNLDGMYYDCVFVFAVDNFRREHFRWVDNPLAFDHQSKKPVMPMAFSVYECAKAMSDDMHNRGKLVMSNYSVTDHPTDLFCLQFIDLIGNEMLWTWTTDHKLSLQRTLAFQKTVSMSWQEAKGTWPEATLEREMKQAMFYGTFYYLSNLSRQLHDRWVPLTERLANAGWEPITYARASGRVMVERFGSHEKGSLHFTLRNEDEKAQAAVLIIDGVSLKLETAPRPEVWFERDSQTSEQLRVHHDGKHWTVPITVPPGDTVVLRVGERSRP